MASDSSDSIPLDFLDPTLPSFHFFDVFGQDLSSQAPWPSVNQNATIVDEHSQAYSTTDAEFSPNQQVNRRTRRL